MHRTLTLLLAALCACGSLAAQVKPAQPAARPGVPERKPIPTELDPSITVYGQELVAQWRAASQGANMMPPRAKAFPGQRLIVALGAGGDGRQALLQNLRATFTLSWGKEQRTLTELRPVLVRDIKAEGADFVSYAIQAAGAGNTREVQGMLSMASLALFDLEWVVPGDAQDGELRINGSCRVDGQVKELEPAVVSIESFDRAAKEGAFKGEEDLGAWSMTYYMHPEPARLLHAVRAEVGRERAFDFNVMTFYVQALKASPEAARWLAGRLKGEERRAQLYGFLLLREAGMDLSRALGELPEASRQDVTKALEQVPALPDPYDLRIRPDDFYAVTTRMDMLWSIFMATGDDRPVRTIAGLLAWREDWKAFEKAREANAKTGKGSIAPTPELLRAAAYGAAGWSLGSFFRAQGLVPDYIEAMKADPSVPEVVKEELRNLIGNPAFQMK